jgi:hypothetical protein
MRPPQFGADITNQANNEPNLPAVMHCTRMAGRAIIRVVGRCNDAQENNNLGEYLEKKKSPLSKINRQKKRPTSTLGHVVMMVIIGESIYFIDFVKSYLHEIGFRGWKEDRHLY